MVDVDFETRLAAVERSVRLWRTAFAGLAGVVVCGLFVGAGAGDPPDGKFNELRCRVLVVEDANGKFMAGIHNEDGGGVFRKINVINRADKDLVAIGSVGGNEEPNASTGGIILYSPDATVLWDASSATPGRFPKKQ